MLKQYYDILEIDDSATLADLKKAYRKKAKLLHPDVSKIPNAHEKFILLNEAYEYLQYVKTGNLYNSKTSNYSKQEKQYYTYEDWQKVEREAARERARHHAQMEYEAFTKTGIYRQAMAISTLLDFLSILVVLFIFITPIIGYYLQGIQGFVGGFLIIFVTVHFWTDILIYNRIKPKIRDLIPNFLFRRKK